MYDFLVYEFRVSICLAVFYLFYKLLLSRETFHRLNRAVIVGAVAASFLLPVCRVTIYEELPAAPLSDAAAVPAVEAVADAAAPFDWTLPAVLLWIAGAGATLVWIAVSMVRIAGIIRSGRRERLDARVTLVRVMRELTPFSWMRWIVISERDMAENGDAVLRNEHAHIRLCHSWDLLVTDLAGCAQWFNPGMWLLRAELRAIHEYEADAAVLAGGVDAREYQMLLIKKAVGGRWYSVANSLNHSKLKNRITMMLRKKSSRTAAARTLLLFPLASIAVGAFARTAYLPADDKSSEIYRIAQTSEVQGDTVRTAGRVESVSDGASGRTVTTIRYGGDGSTTVTTSTTSTTATTDGTAGSVIATADKRMVSVTFEVVDSQSGEPIPGVIVLQTVSSTNGGHTASASRSSVTDKSGRAKMEVACGVPVRFMMVNYSDFAMTVSDGFDGMTARVALTPGESSVKAAKSSEKVLYIVDGKQTDSDALAGIDPSTIKSMTVLKDAASTAEYGDNAADGVVIVTTKGADGGESVTTKGADGGESVTRTVTATSENGTTCSAISVSKSGQSDADTAACIIPKQSKGKTVYYIDGRRVSRKAVEKLPAGSIANVNVDKRESVSRVDITTKQAG